MANTQKEQIDEKIQLLKAQKTFINSMIETFGVQWQIIKAKISDLEREKERLD